MKNTKLTIIALYAIALSTILTSCGKGTPDPADPESINLVKQLFRQEKLDAETEVKDEEIEVKNIRTLEVDKEVGICKNKAMIVYSNMFAFDIVYTLQYNVDDNLYIEGIIQVNEEESRKILSEN